jgi:hypothetical protein
LIKRQSECVNGKKYTLKIDLYQVKTRKKGVKYLNIWITNAKNAIKLLKFK